MLSLIGLSTENVSGVMGGIVLISLIMWGLILRCYLSLSQFSNQEYAQTLKATLSCYSCMAKPDQVLLIQGWLSQVRLHLQKGLAEIRLFVRVLPMLGLLGTVDGMMRCFARLNSDDVLQAVSDGISQAMLTTLAGLVAALSGMYFAYHLQRRNQHLLLTLKQKLECYEN